MSRLTVYIALQQFCEHDDGPRRLLEGAGLDVRSNTLGRRLRREEMRDVLREAEAVIAGVEPYDAEVLASLPRLRCISRCGVGTDAIDLEAARRQGIVVFNTPDEVVEPVAQLTLAMILALARNFPQHLTETRGGVWRKRTGVLLGEWTIGLVGFGRIGRALERLLRPMGPRMLVTDPALSRGDVPEGVRACRLPELLAEADVVSLHASRPSQQGPLIGAAELARMKPGSFLVNTARGYLVDEAALQRALERGHVAGAALDVFAEEPSAGALCRQPQVLCTPHVASLTRASRAAMERRAAQQVVDWSKTCEPGTVNRDPADGSPITAHGS